MDNLYSEGKTFRFTAGSGGVNPGAVVVSGRLVGISAGKYDEGDEGIASLDGAYWLPKTAPQEWSQGDKIYLIEDTGVCTTTKGTDPVNVYIGEALVAAASADVEGVVLLCRKGAQVANE